jgi:hypothetical protein
MPFSDRWVSINWWARYSPLNHPKSFRSKPLDPIRTQRLLNRFSQVTKCIRKPAVLASITSGGLEALRVTKQGFSVICIQIQSDHGIGFLGYGQRYCPCGQ